MRMRLKFGIRLEKTFQKLKTKLFKHLKVMGKAVGSSLILLKAKEANPQVVCEGGNG